MRQKLVLLLLASALALGLTACGGDPPSDSDSSDLSSSVSSSLSSSSDAGGSDSSESSAPATRTVGREGFGYVELPADWLMFRDPNAAEDALQYCDPAGRAILTLYGVYNPEGDAEASAAALRDTITGDGASNVTADTATLGDSTAYQVSGYYESEDIQLVTWFLKTPDDYVRYVAIEAGKDDIDGWVEQVKTTYRLEMADASAGPPEDLAPVPATRRQPARLGEWAETKRYSAQDGAYHTVFVRVTAVERDAGTVRAAIDAYNAAGPTAPIAALENDALQYALLRYEVYFPDDFPEADWGVTSVDMTFRVADAEGGDQDENGAAGLAEVRDISNSPALDAFHAGSTFLGGRAVFVLGKEDADVLLETFYIENDEVISAYFAGQ